MQETNILLGSGRQLSVSVGIVSGLRIAFSLNALYRVAGRMAHGDQTAIVSDGKIRWQGGEYEQLDFHPLSVGASFSLNDVTIGVGFHWERRERQTFLGALRLIVDGGKLCAVNVLPVEAYLESVISSEMRATSSLELLKAHAVVSRSWLLAQMMKRGSRSTTSLRWKEAGEAPEELISWQDREDHTRFDVCADDHCQRYQGVTRETSPLVAEAIRQTRGQVLVMGGQVCDTRFSKCCGGVTEEFQFCWEDSPRGYLKAVADSAHADRFPDLTVEANAERWIRSAPASFCNTTDHRVLAQVLNDYDQETTDFYRWTVEYTQADLASIVRARLKWDFGEIVDLIPLARGKSGRICRLKIVGTRRTLIIGKELSIRQALSRNTLYSSAFVVDKILPSTPPEEIGAKPVPTRFRLVGAGWGHGVGLCQIGAAMMGEQGYAYDAILRHYYQGVEIRAVW